ncbi:S-methyl-5-thioribose kinase [Cohnella sp. CIP 111063]|uniref:S-methyl-5-thioribose kinase n=1 Tax=unclassified Cohnella TaxID=2636738 RepID=UPI000B8BEF31|nr:MULTISPECIES: S-methyl-5-thioribose kinase [unclassified Cohnella]OXS55625.1 S-methyl-5-thioribose kinase [Cohnella sp. CIP 111063]PRX66471.1 5'-methylthioribose kinase [Cohnella sp. SGD-V74]
MSNYHPLTEQEAIEIAQSIAGVFGPEGELRCREIGDGNLNLVFHISQASTGSGLIVKQSLPYAKVVGESWPLSLDRARIESEALIIEDRLAPGLVPKVYHSDNELALTVMEDLSSHVIMRQGLIDGGVYPLFAEHISDFLAKTLFFTSDLGMNQQEKKQLAGSFVNPDLCKITEDLIFDHPYTNADTNSFDPHLQADAEKLWADQELHLEVALLREKFLTHAQALLHGDLHTGSIFVTEQSTKVIDPEFAYFGPMGFDIGAVIANLLLHYASQEHWSADEASRQERRQYLLAAIRDIWNGFERKFRALWNEHGVDRIAKTAGYQNDYVSRLLQDTAGFAGAKIVRRIVGLAHVADIDKIPDADVRARAQRLALAIGTTLIKRNRRIASIEDIIDIADSAARV